MRRLWTLPALMAAGLLAAACETQSGEDADAGLGGGGNGGNGGAGGEVAPDAGEGGGVEPGVACSLLTAAACENRADCVVDDGACQDAEGAACALLREAQCTGRDDCAPRLDVTGGFIDCQPLAEVPCGMLDEARCGARDECVWTGESCGLPTPACDTWGDAGTCEASGCFWWADACHADRAPRLCDEPDRDACVAAGCEWTPDGCREPDEPPMVCESLSEVACSARADCVWAGDHCETDRSGMACEALTPEECALRNDCSFDPRSGACIVRAEGPCEQLDENACVVRPDCAPQYQQPVDCVPPQDGMGGGGGADPGEPAEPVDPANGGGEGAPQPSPDEPPADAAPAPPCPPDDPNCMEDPPQGCLPVFIGCGPNEPPPPALCDGLDPETCSVTPGCHLEEGCAPCPEGQICPAVCELELLCVADAGPACWNLTPDQCVNTPGCHLEGGMGACDCFIDADGREICECFEGDAICAPDAPQGCGVIFDEGTCWNTPGCTWELSPDCDGGGAVPGCDCDPADPNCACDALIAPACGRCIDILPPDPCAGLPAEQCLPEFGCMLVGIPCDCGVDENGQPIMCDCDGGQFCVPAPAPCSYFDEASCWADPACEWFGFGADPLPPEDCGCPPDDPACDCGGRPFPGEGFCQVRWIEPCGATPVEACEATPGCGIQELMPPCAPCDPDLPPEACPVCEPVPVCAPLDQICGGLDPASCADDPRCEVFVGEACQGGGVDCLPGQPCPEPEPGVCEVFEYCGAARNRCVNIAADVCAMMASCVALTDEAGNFDICWDANVCDGLNAVQCDSHPSCHLEILDGPCGCFIDESGREICECAPGGEWCVPDFQPPPPPPPGAECRADADCPAPGAPGCQAMCVDGLCAVACAR